MNTEVIKFFLHLVKFSNKSYFIIVLIVFNIIKSLKL